MAECLDSPFVLIQKQNVRIDFAFRHPAMLVIVLDVQATMGLPGLKHGRKNGRILCDAALGKHFQRADERLL